MIRLNEFIELMIKNRENYKKRLINNFIKLKKEESDAGTEEALKELTKNLRDVGINDETHPLLFSPTFSSDCVPLNEADANALALAIESGSIQCRTILQEILSELEIEANESEDPCKLFFDECPSDIWDQQEEAAERFKQFLFKKYPQIKELIESEHKMSSPPPQQSNATSSLPNQPSQHPSEPPPPASPPKTLEQSSPPLAGNAPAPQEEIHPPIKLSFAIQLMNEHKISFVGGIAVCIIGLATLGYLATQGVLAFPTAASDLAAGVITVTGTVLAGLGGLAATYGLFKSGYECHQANKPLQSPGPVL